MSPRIVREATPMSLTYAVKQDMNKKTPIAMLTWKG